MRTSRADRFYMGMLAAVICLCMGIIGIMDEAHAEAMAEREAARAAAQTHIIKAVEIVEITPAVYTYLSQVEAAEPLPPVEEADTFAPWPSVPLAYDLQEVLWEECQEHNIEYELALGLIEVESTFRTDAVSYVGCYGLMQLNPKYFPSDLSPADNIRYGIEFLEEKLDQYAGDLGAALTAYNAGHDTGNREYAEKVMAAAGRWREQ